MEGFPPSSLTYDELKKYMGRLVANNKPQSEKFYFYPLSVLIENILDSIGVGIAENNGLSLKQGLAMRLRG